MDPRFLGGLDGAGCEFDVLPAGAGQGGDPGTANCPSDVGDGVEVALRGDGESGFKNVDAEVCQAVGERELLIPGHGAARRLLSVTEGGVEEVETIAVGN